MVQTYKSGRAFRVRSGRAWA